MEFLSNRDIQEIAFRGLTSGLGVALFCLIISLLYQFFKRLMNKA